MNLNPKRMTVQPRASVSFGNIRQPVRCLKAKFLKYFHLALLQYLHLFSSLREASAAR
jgi:hypothetical protein